MLNQIANHARKNIVKMIYETKFEHQVLLLASNLDLKNTVRIGQYVVDCALSNKTGVMVDLVANKVKEFPIIYESGHLELPQLCRRNG